MMNKHTNFAVAALAGSIALAMSTAAMAQTAPAAGQLPGKGSVVLGTVNAGAVAGQQQTITIGSGSDTQAANAVINWGTGADINAGGIGGFNIGAGGTLTFADGTADGSGAAVLNIDSSGNPSQIFGTLNTVGSNTSVFVANENGIIIGNGATVSTSGDLGFIANHLTSGGSTDFAGLGSLAYDANGGDVTVQSGASINGGTSTLIAGGGVVNVSQTALDGAAGTTKLSAGVSSDSSAVNSSAALGVSGSGAALRSFLSGGSASNSGTLDLSSAGGYYVAGLFTNTGNLTLGVQNGSVDNEGTLNTTGSVGFRALTNGTGHIYNANAGTVNLSGGDLINNGTINTANTIVVTDGNIINNGGLNGVYNLSTASDAARASGADFSITNNGTIISQGSLSIDANRSVRASGDTDSTGSFTGSSTSRISVAATTGNLSIKSRNNITLAGALQTGTGSNAANTSASNPMGFLTLSSSGFDLTKPNPVFVTNGVTSLLSPVWVSGAILHGNQVKVMDNLSSVASSNPSGTVTVVAGPTMGTADYAIRVAAGKTISAGTITVTGSERAVQPNVILQGTISANTLNLGTYTQPVSDVFSGPSGSLVAAGSAPTVSIAFTGKVKNAPYLNSANFRYNYLPITATGGSVSVGFKPVSYNTNGTSNGLSAVNVLVNGDVTLLPAAYISSPAIYGNGTATGPNVIPNTHLVVQSTGNIATGSGAFYWPGLFYLGNISATNGTPNPGTLGNGTITLGGNFSNTLPGSLDSGGGIHFITRNALAMNGFSVTTNANSWINFGTEELTQGYASGSLAGSFYGGTQGVGSVVNYGPLDPSLFHAHPPVATR